MKNNKKWFTLLLLILFITAFSIGILSLLSVYNTIYNQDYVNNKKLQAMNYAVEWMEMVKWYFATEINKNKINSWSSTIRPLSWKYVIFFDSSGYVITSKEKETIEVNEPYVVDYIREIEINNWDNINEKKVTVTVDYWESTKVSFETTLANLYWK